MTYIVTDNCIKCKHMDCIEVCPVDCFYEGENMLVINPDECIDCGVCQPECPVDAIVPENAISTTEKEKWLNINILYSNKWPNKTVFNNSEVPEDAEEYAHVENKYEKYFSPNPGKGD
jgi:ferredoxin